jgi:hypothetical protein
VELASNIISTSRFLSLQGGKSMNRRRISLWVSSFTLIALLFVQGVIAQEGPILLDAGTTGADVPGPVVVVGDSELMVEPVKGPVQGIISIRHEEIIGDEVHVFIGGMIAVQTDEGWQGAAKQFYFDATGTTFERAQIEQGWRIVLEAPE